MCDFSELSPKILGFTNASFNIQAVYVYNTYIYMYVWWREGGGAEGEDGKRRLNI